MLRAKTFNARDNKRRTGPFSSQSHADLTGLRRTPVAMRAGSGSGGQCTPALDARLGPPPSPATSSSSGCGTPLSLRALASEIYFNFAWLLCLDNTRSWHKVQKVQKRYTVISVGQLSPNCSLPQRQLLRIPCTLPEILSL